MRLFMGAFIIAMGKVRREEEGGGRLSGRSGGGGGVFVFV